MPDNQKDQPEDELTEAQKKTRHQLRMRFEFRDLIEDMIQEGQERGAFDNLPGKGKPLNLQRNPFEGERELANALLKENKVLPAWLMQRNAISLDIEALRLDIRRRWARFDQVYQTTVDNGRLHALRRGWSELCDHWLAEITRLNKAIDTYNLGRPSENLELFKLRLDDELRRAGAARDLA